MDPIEALQKEIREKNRIDGAYRIGREQIERCWEIDILHDSKWRMEAIKEFALENGWKVDVSISPEGWAAEFKSSGDRS